ncbi:MAG: TRAP transporter large permease [Betaproteobacteria bacterium]|nr:MAG: TRAP transporter large permease [Betaproteobacteria bacterium]TMH80853.1 MAG: TRAP transporter large permease [Betaproteobacteria bacterium]
MTEGLLGLAAFLLLAFMRVPMAFAMGIVGFFGFAWKVNFGAAASMIAQTTYETGLAYTLSVIPLFILMGNFVVRARMSEELYHAAYTFLGHKRGGLAMSTIVACAGFGAICGSSIATAATFAKVAYPSMRKFGYKDTLASGSIAAGGTLGILIPPSVIMVIYGIMTETNIGKLFAAGIFPGIVATALLCLAVAWMTRRDPLAGPPGERSSWPARLEAIRHVWPVVLLFIVVIGGIYAGVFTATEGAGIGAGGALVFALARRALGWRTFVEVLIESVRTTSMLFMILIGALIFANFVNYTTMPSDLKGFVTQFAVHPILVVVAICAVYVVLGTAMEELSMILLTVPLFFPVVTALGFDAVWFGIIIVIVVQIGLISPPVGMNIFVVKSLLRHLTIGTVFRGVLPFNVALVALLAIVVAFPSIATWLPGFMK